jgi:hypothetical protein
VKELEGSWTSIDFLIRAKEWRSKCGDGREVALDATSTIIGSAGKERSIERWGLGWVVNICFEF